MKKDGYRPAGATNQTGAACVRILTRAFVLTATLTVALCSRFATADDRNTFFDERVAKILERRCLQCHHGVDAKGGLSLETAAAVARGGDSGPALAPGKPDESLLFSMVGGDKPQMPKNAEPLTAGEVATLRQWVEQGAPFPKDATLVDRRFEGQAWWSLEPLVRPAIPELTSPFIRTPVDAFILQALRAKGLSPSHEADRLTLLRRLKFDLHGLPPTPDEVDEFLADASPDAYERLVDRLLASPRYGERWGRFWLDLVHFGETHGYDKDKVRANAWPYRDYVIAAFNRDKPYARFVREQLAGDVFLPGQDEGTIATGFISAGPWDFVGHVELREGTVDKLIARSNDRDDMVMTAMSTFVSMTVHCARCHDHKFDPIAQADYYRLQAAFAGVDRGDQPYFGESAARARYDALVAEREALRERHKAAVVVMNQTRNPETDSLAARLQGLRERIATIEVPAADSPSNGYHSGIEPRADAEKWVQVDLGAALPIDLVRLVPARPTDFPDTPGFGFPVRFKVEVATAADFSDRQTLADRSAEDDANPRDNAVEIDGQGKMARYVRVTALRLWQRTDDYVFALGELEVEAGAKNVAGGSAVTALDSIEAGRWSTKHLVDGFDSRYRLEQIRRADSPLALRRELEAEAQAIDAEKAQKVAALLAESVREELSVVPGQIAQVEKRLATLPPMKMVYAAAGIPPRTVEILRRGSVRDPGPVVSPGALACVAGLPSVFPPTDPADGRTRRAQLADWIADPRNVLARRSIVNRVWQQHFGKGLVDTPSDFGRMGSLPTHPELLDWLAVEFLEGGESFKALHRLLVTSGVYRQSSRQNEAAAAVDAGNRLLWRMNRARLDAEAVRDAALVVAGRLDVTMGGPSDRQFFFKDDHSPVYDYARFDVDEPRANRRAVYRFLVRSVPDPFMECLDCADPSLLAPQRTTTVTSLQALALLNNRFVLRQCERFAERVAAMAPDVEGQIRAAYKLAFGREPGADELRQTAEHARKHGLANVCRLLVNSNEFMFVD